MRRLSELIRALLKSICKMDLEIPYLQYPYRLWSSTLPISLLAPTVSLDCFSWFAWPERQSITGDYGSYENTVDTYLIEFLLSFHDMIIDFSFGSRIELSDWKAEMIHRPTITRRNTTNEGRKDLSRINYDEMKMWKRLARRNTVIAPTKLPNWKMKITVVVQWVEPEWRIHSKTKL